LELKHENKRQIQQKIALHTLPMAFEDAMRVWQFLDIPYLWIDQLCILLDDDDELADEISNMGYIYENAHVNIGAMVAAETVHEDRRNGLFVDRQNFAFSNNPVCARIRRRGYEKECSILDDDPRMDLNFKDIMRCGGIMQERILSPRSIFFDRQLLWKCSELLACEYFPAGAPIDNDKRLPPSTWGNKTPFNINSMILDARKVGSQRMSRLECWLSQYQCWMKLVEQYSSCGLTRIAS
jgi:hypothetical protein